MRKNIILCSLLLGMSLACGCSKSQTPQDNQNSDAVVEESTQESAEPKEDTKEVASEDVSKDDTQAGDDSKESEEAQELELLDRVSDDEIKLVLDEMLTWAGTKYFYDPVTEFSELDDTTKIDMAAFACEMNSNEDDGIPKHTDDWRLIIENDDMEKKMNNLFGDSYDGSKYIDYKNSYVRIDGSVLSISQGDWGLVVPIADYEAKYEDNSNDFVIEASYTAYDFSENVEISGYEYLMTYQCVLSSESENGFIIKNLTSVNKGSLPEKFDPASVAGIYVSDWGQEVEGEDASNLSYIQLKEDGSGTWVAKGAVPLAFDGYDIFVGSVDNPMPYSFYEGEITIYPTDEEYEHYVKTNMTAEEFELLVDKAYEGSGQE